MARAALAGLPAEFRAYLGDIVFAVEEYADEETLAALGIDHPLDLSGLYHGRPVGEKSSMDSGAMPDRIFLYRRAILEERSEEHTSELQSLMRISYAVFCLKKKKSRI